MLSGAKPTAVNAMPYLLLYDPARNVGAPLQPTTLPEHPTIEDIVRVLQRIGVVTPPGVSILAEPMPKASQQAASQQIIRPLI